LVQKDSVAAKHLEMVATNYRATEARPVIHLRPIKRDDDSANKALLGLDPQ